MAIISWALLCCSCATYNRQISNYYSQMVNTDYHKAYASIDNIRKLQTGRNRLLYLFEKGKMAHLMMQYDSSNRYFNEADLFMEDARTSAKDIAVGTLLNPMMQTYKGEDFEKYMVHYYKALNYLYLGQEAAALVEARRITLRSYSQQEKKYGYTEDAFSLMLQGIIYEQTGDINNAFIAYRNATNLYLENNDSYYGVPLPVQLKKDVIRTAVINGFSAEADRYRKLFNITSETESLSEGGELILFWENGLAPVKREQQFIFSLTKDGGGNFMFADALGNYHIPFQFANDTDRDNVKLENFRSFRVAFPVYEEQPLYFHHGVATVNNSNHAFENAENINTLAFATLKERFLKDMAVTLGRLAVKKLAEEAVRPDKDDKNKNEKEAMAVALQVFNFISEKADTRNWQSLPHTIHYTRIPLRKGKNLIFLQLKAGQDEKKIELNVQGTGRLQLRNVCTLK